MTPSRTNSRMAQHRSCNSWPPEAAHTTISTPESPRPRTKTKRSCSALRSNKCVRYLRNHPVRLEKKEPEVLGKVSGAIALYMKYRFSTARHHTPVRVRQAFFFYNRSLPHDRPFDPKHIASQDCLARRHASLSVPALAFCGAQPGIGLRVASLPIAVPLTFALVPAFLVVAVFGAA